MTRITLFVFSLIFFLANPTHAESGVASYYGGGDGLCGSRTATGARFNCNGLTAAHKTMPFGTKLLITHEGRSVCVTINDRGPFIRGRVLDLSYGAAKAIGLTARGVGRVSYFSGC